MIEGAYATRQAENIRTAYRNLSEAVQTPPAQQAIQLAMRNALDLWTHTGVQEETRLQSERTVADRDRALGAATASIAEAPSPAVANDLFVQHLGAMKSLYASQMDAPGQLQAGRTLADQTLSKQAAIDPAGFLAAHGAAPAVAAQIMPFLIEQESNGRAGAISPKGALGVAQMLPSTAREVATGLGLKDVAALPDAALQQRLLTDPALNRRMGEAYLDTLLTRYDGNRVLALAAYNAGMGRLEGYRDTHGVRHPGWLKSIGDPRKGAISDRDFAAAIPFKETRNYVADITGRMAGPAADLASPTGMRTAIAQAVDALQARKDEEVDGLEKAIDGGSAGVAEVEAAHRSGLFVADSPDHARLRGKAEAREEEAQERAVAVRRVAMARTGGRPLQPSHPSDRRAVDRAFSTEYEKWSSPETQVPGTARFAARVGMIPSEARRMITEGVRSNKPGFRTSALTFYAAIRDRDKSLLRDLPDDVVRNADFMLTLTQRGAGPQDLVSLGDYMKNMDAREIHRRTDDFMRWIGPRTDGVFRQMLIRQIMPDRDVRTSGLQAGFKPPPAMLNDFVSMSTTYYISDPDPDRALKAGYERVRRIWGPNFSGEKPTFMKYPPEAVGPLGFGQSGLSTRQNWDWIREQALQDARLPKETRIMLSTIPNREGADGKPRYTILYQGSGGRWLTARGPDSGGLVWKPDYQTSQARARADKAAKEGMAKAERLQREHEAFLKAGMPSPRYGGSVMF